MATTNLHEGISTVGALAAGVKATALGVAAFGNAFGELGSAAEKCGRYCNNAMDGVLEAQASALAEARLQQEATLKKLQATLLAD